MTLTPAQYSIGANNRKHSLTLANMADADLMKEVDVARTLNVHAATLARWRRSGAGPTCIRINGRVYYRQADVEQWLESKSHGASKTAP